MVKPCMSLKVRIKHIWYDPSPAERPSAAWLHSGTILGLYETPQLRTHMYQPDQSADKQHGLLSQTA